MNKQIIKRQYSNQIMLSCENLIGLLALMLERPWY